MDNHPGATHVAAAVGVRITEVCEGEKLRSEFRAQRSGSIRGRARRSGVYPHRHERSENGPNLRNHPQGSTGRFRGSKSGKNDRSYYRLVLSLAPP